MTSRIPRLFLVLTLMLLALTTNQSQAIPLNTAFTYQGRLAHTAQPANGTYDLTFSLFDAATNGTQVANTITNSTVNVTNGLFSTTLDFGLDPFTNTLRWLEITVRPNNTTNAYTTLSPRQALTPTPQSIFASQAGTLLGQLPDSQLSANIPRLNTPQTFTAPVTFSSSVTGNFFGNGFSLTNLSAFNLIGKAPDSVLSTNIPRLDATSNRFSGTLSAKAASFGEGHILSGNRSGIYSGSGNTINAFAWDSAILGGVANSLRGDVFFFGSTMVGGQENSLFNPSYTTLLGGHHNNIANDNTSAILGGQFNTMTNSAASTIAGGANNSILNSSSSAILGGSQNTITNTDSAAILGGALNSITSGAVFSSILGGILNTVTQPNAIVGGYHAYANNSYTFVWADASSANNFTTTASHQFLVRAMNGVGINTNNPATALHVNGTITANGLNVSGSSLIADHLRLGALVNTSSNAPGYGKALIFSGTPDTSASWNNDNSDPIWMARYNSGDNQSQLRLSLGDDSNADDKFLIGVTTGAGSDFSQNGSWLPKFSIDSAGSVRASGTIQATTAPDIAETIPAAEDVEAGDVVVANPNQREHAIRARKGDRAVLGVISDGSGGFLINAHGNSPDAPLTGKPLVLAGRVPVKVSLENGPIIIGDFLTLSSIPGVAMRATEPGPTVGIALDDYTGSENQNEIGKVLCFIKVSEATRSDESNNTALIQQLTDANARLEKALNEKETRITALEQAVLTLQQSIQSK